MNTRTSLIAIGATLALIAPAAANARAIVNQSGDMYSTYFAAEHGSHAFANTNFVSENGHKATSRKAQVHKIAKTNTIVTPRYIYVAGPAPASSAYVDPNECQNTGGNCTDLEACTYWGENCDIVTGVPPDASPASLTTH